MNNIQSFFTRSYPQTLVYMLQSTEYQPGPYLRWYWRTQNFNNVMKRRVLDPTKAAKLLIRTLQLGMLLQILVGLLVIVLWRKDVLPGGWLFGVALLVSYPVIWAHLIVVPLILGRTFIINPRELRWIEESKTIFANHPGTKIAVAGSYGKTSMKEILATVLGEAKKVAVTPANKNVASSHAIFARKLKGDEDILVIEFGEGQPGDVAQFSETVQPNLGVITGIAPAHLDHYPTLESAAKDIFSLADFLHNQNIYVNGESPAAKNYIKPDHHVYSSKGIDSWRVKNIKVGFEGTEFTLYRKNDQLKLKTALVGQHQIGPLAAAAVIALNLGISKGDIEKGVARTKPFEHRMQPLKIGGAWIIDDTYNGNIDGMRVGLRLLNDLPAKRRIYITPGLVDQGVETERVHIELGNLITKAKPDKVVLMKNSATPFIQKGLKEGDYQGEVILEENPLDFYLNIEHFVAAGDVLLMQNDWTDNYA